MHDVLSAVDGGEVHMGQTAVGLHEEPDVDGAGDDAWGHQEAPAAVEQRTQDLVQQSATCHPIIRPEMIEDRRMDQRVVGGAFPVVGISCINIKLTA